MGGGGKVGSGVHDSYTFPVQTDHLLPLAKTPDRRDQRLLVSLPKDTGKVG